MEKGDTEWDKHNMYSRTIYFCDFCEEVWYADWDDFEQITTFTRGEGDDYHE